MKLQKIDERPRRASAQPEGTVFEQVFNLLKEWGHCDLILDRAMSNPLDDELTELVAQQKAHPINPRKAAHSVDECLMMGRLSQDQLSFLERSIQLGLDQNIDLTRQIRAVGGWLFSRGLTSKIVARHLEKAIIVRIQQSPDALLRLWDPRVIGHLPRILTHEQMAALLGPIECWTWIDRSGQLQLLKRPATSAAAALSAPLPLRLSAEQSEAIDRIEHINTLLKALAKLGHSIAPERDHELDELLQAAQRKGHDKVTDMLAYCLHALLISKTFDTIPKVQQVIAQAQAKSLGLCVALEQFDDDFWEAHKTTAWT